MPKPATPVSPAWSHEAVLRFDRGGSNGRYRRKSASAWTGWPPDERVVLKVPLKR